MRFGIMAMQMDALLPSSGSPEQMMAQVAAFNHAGLVEKLVHTGFNLIELGGDLVLFLPNSFNPAAVDGLARLKAEQKLSYTVHLPLWSVEPSTPLTPVRQGSAQAIIDCINATRSLDPEAYVLHATGALAAEFYRMRLPESGRAILLRQFQAAASHTIQTVLTQTGISPRKLALETIEFPFDLTLQMAEQFDCSICLDTGHVMAQFAGQVDLFDVLERVLPRLAEIHLHDCPQQTGSQIGYSLDHQALGKGSLDTARLLDRLSAAHWNGPIIFELSVPEALASLQVIRSLRPNYLA